MPEYHRTNIQKDRPEVHQFHTAEAPSVIQKDLQKENEQCQADEDQEKNLKKLNMGKVTWPPLVATICGTCAHATTLYAIFGAGVSHVPPMLRFQASTQRWCAVLRTPRAA